jgi:hypothetical protein
MMMQLNGYKGNNMSLGGSSSSSQQLDPKLRDLYLKNYQSAENVASRLGPRQFQGFTPDQQTAFGVTRQFADPNSQQMQQLGGAANIAERAGMYQPSNVFAQGVSAAGANAAALNRGDVRNIQGGSVLQQDMGAYMSPYTQAVTQQGLQDINRSRQLAQQQGAASAVAAKAFGGSRQAIAEAETNRAYDENAARFVGQQNAQAFQSAQQAALSDLARQMQAQQANQAVDLSTGQLNVENLQQANLANQAALNQARQFNVGTSLQAQQANQAAGLQANQQRIGASGQLANIGAQGQQMGFAGANQLAQQGLLQQGFTQQQIDALRNLPLEQQQIINQALGINVGGGSGMQSSSSSGQGIFGLFR